MAVELSVEEILENMEEIVLDRPSSSDGCPGMKLTSVSGADSRERTRSPEGQSWSLDSFSGVSELGEPGPATYFPDDRSLSHHKHFPSVTIGRGPGHAPLGTLSLPVSGHYGLGVNDKSLSHRRRSSSVTIGRGPGHESFESTLIVPGPASYDPNDRLQAHHKHFPSATFGRGPGHSGQSMAPSTPGPADFCGDDRVEARHRRSSSVTIGSGPGHGTADSGIRASPGPAAYNADDRLLSWHRQFPTSTIGHGPGHVSLLPTDATPAPGSYNVANRAIDSRYRLSASVSMPRVGRDHPNAEERLRFRRADRNKDGVLEFGEIKSLLQGRFSDMKDADVRAVFDAIDRNRDGKLDLEEVVDYTHSPVPDSRKRREKMMMALAAPGLSQSFCEHGERVQFRRADLNLDDALGLNEVESLMRHSFHDIKRRDVHDMFHAIDKNRDGKLDFQEVVDYTRSKDPSNKRLREKMRTALAHYEHSGASGPGSKQTNSSMRRVSSASVVGSAIARGRQSP